jgi:hypothetical protein
MLQSGDVSKSNGAADHPPNFRLPKPVVLTVTLSNPSTRLQFRDGGVFRPDGKRAERDDPWHWSIFVLELEDSGLVLDVPRESCSQGEEVLLELRAVSEQPTTGEPREVDLLLKIQARVSQQSFENNGAERGNSTFQFLRHDEALWRKLRAYYETRQRETQRVLEAMKE